MFCNLWVNITADSCYYNCTRNASKVLIWYALTAELLPWDKLLLNSAISNILLALCMPKCIKPIWHSFEKHDTKKLIQILRRLFSNKVRSIKVSSPNTTSWFKPWTKFLCNQVRQWRRQIVKCKDYKTHFNVLNCDLRNTTQRVTDRSRIVNLAAMNNQF